MGVLVSVIVTTKNEEKVIGKLLQSLFDQSYKNIEVLLVDNNSTDRTVEIAKKFNVKIYNFGPERSSQRNFGASKALGKYLLILDADMQLEEDVIGQCVEMAEGDKQVGDITIPEISIAKTFWEKVKTFERSFYYLEGSGVEASRFFRTAVFKQVGGYDETITGAEDWDLPETIGKLKYKRGRIRARIHHYERIKSLLSLVKKKYYYGLKSHRYFDKQKIFVISPKSVYFFRAVFYRQWRRLLSHPILTSAMFLMFTLEMVGGGVGYLQGRIRNY